MSASYRIADEPRPGPMNHLAVNPFWPLLAIMLGGAWLSWPWFIVNGLAIGSPSRRREILLVLLGLGGAAVLVVSFVLFGAGGLIPKEGIPYALIAITVWKLGISYWIYVTQQRTFAIWEYYGGNARNGMMIALIGMFVGRRGISELLHQNVVLTMIALVLQ